MFKKIKALLTSEKKSELPFEITLDEIPAWLDTQASTCEKKRTDRMKTVRDTLDLQLKKMNQVITDLGSEEHDEAKHPKVEQVIRHSLPQFKKRVETQITREFLGDDEEVYRQIAEVVQGCFSAYRGPGKYLHQLYPEGIRDFRDVLDSMGHEMNSITKIIKISRDRLMDIDSVKKEYQRYIDAKTALNEHITGLAEIKGKCQEIDTHISNLQKEEEQLKGSDLYSEYKGLVAQSERHREIHMSEQERYESACRTAVSVCKRASRVYGDAGRLNEQKIIESLEEACLSVTSDCQELSIRIQKSADLIFELLYTDDLTLKNTFEKALFTDKESVIMGLSGSCTAAIAAHHHHMKQTNIYREHPVHTALPHFSEMIEKHLFTLEKNRDEERVHAERIEILSAELQQAGADLVVKMAQCLKKDPDTVRISGLDEHIINPDLRLEVDDSGESV